MSYLGIIALDWVVALLDHITISQVKSGQVKVGALAGWLKRMGSTIDWPILQLGQKYQAEPNLEMKMVNQISVLPVWVRVRWAGSLY